MIRYAFAALILTAAEAFSLELEIPVRCEPGRDCYIQSFADRMPGPGAADFTCGTLSYDGHDGTDFRVATLRDMARGVDVLAAAAGRVRAMRDGEPDTGLAGTIEGRECGNGLAIDHGAGWETQYCHLASGSIAVQTGETVEAGHRLGEIGLSGSTEFPHLHLTVRHYGEVVDPFDARSPTADCELDDSMSLWSPEARAALTYRPGGIVDFGFTNGPIDLASIREGIPHFEALDPPALVFWVRYFGLNSGDQLSVTLLSPDGEILANTDADIPRPRAEHMIFAGRKRPAGGWVAGSYRAEARLIRNGQFFQRSEGVLALP